MKIMKLFATLVLAMGAGTIACVSADTASAAIVFPDSVALNEPPIVTLSPATNIDFLIDGSGLSAPLLADESNAAAVTHLGYLASPNTHWVTSARNGSGVDYFPGTSPVLTFTFTGVQSIGSMYLWGYTGSNFSAGGNTPSQANVEFFDGITSLGSVAVNIPPIATATGSQFAGLIGFGSSFAADSVAVTFTENHGDGTAIPGSPLSGGDRVGAGEIAFSNVVRPVPEPGTLVLGLVGLGALLMARRRGGSIIPL